MPFIFFTPLIENINILKMAEEDKDSKDHIYS